MWILGEYFSKLFVIEKLHRKNRVKKGKIYRTMIFDDTDFVFVLIQRRIILETRNFHKILMLEIIRCDNFFDTF